MKQMIWTCVSWRSLATAVLMAVAFPAVAGLTVTTNDTVVAVAGSGELKEPFLSPDVSSVVFSGQTQIRYLPAAASTYVGGTEITSGQLFVARADSLGTGPVRVGTADRGALLVRDADVTLANKVIFEPKTGSYAAGYSEASTIGLGKITLTSVGTPEDGTSHAIRFGRMGANSPSRVTLALTGDDSEAIDRISVSGSVDLTFDGGVLKARADAKSPFVNPVIAGETSIKVTTNGLTLAVAEGGAVDFGLPVTFSSGVRTDVLETLVPENSSFENGSAGWEISGGQETGSEVKTSPSPFNSNSAGTVVHPPPGGDKNFVMLRRGATLSRTVRFPSAGLWRVRYWRGCRPDGYSRTVTTTVRLNGVTVQELPAGDDPLAFTEYVTDGVEVAADQDCPFEIVVGQSTLESRSLNFDAISFERVSAEPFGAPVKKTGAGVWSFSGVAVSNAAFTVEEGTLSFHGLALDNASVTVLKDATVRTLAATLAESVRVGVQAGGTWVLSDLNASMLSNGGFESQQFSFQPATPTDWNLAVVEATANNKGSGLLHNGDAVFGEIVAAEGTEAAYLREKTALSQPVTVTKEGDYRLSFARAFRKYAKSHQIPVTVFVDGAEIGTAAGVSEWTSTFDYFAFDLFLTAGSHTIRLETGTTAAPELGEMVFIDDVRLEKVMPMEDVLGVVRLEPGATLVLANSRRCRLLNVWVGEEKLTTGNATTLASRGVIVQGSGKVWLGTPPGAVILVR